MPENKTEITQTFDKNQIMIDIMQSIPLSRNFDFAMNFSALANEHFHNWGGARYVGPRSEQNLKEEKQKFAQFPAAQRLLDVLYGFYSNPSTKEADDFFKFWDFMAPLFYDNPEILDLMNIVNKIDTFNPNAQLAIIRFIANKRIFVESASYRPFLNAALTHMANNKLATGSDKAIVLRYMCNDDLVRDTIDTLKKELHTELNKEYPDKKVLESLCKQAIDSINYYRYAHSVHGSMDGKSPEWLYIQSVYEEFNLQNVLAGGATYIPQLTTSMEERMAKAEAEKLQLEAKVREKDAEIKRLERELATSEQKNTRLTEQLNTISQESDEKTDKLRRLREASGKMKGGLFGKSSVEEFQQFINQETNTL